MCLGSSADALVDAILAGDERKLGIMNWRSTIVFFALGGLFSQIAGAQGTRPATGPSARTSAEAYVHRLLLALRDFDSVAVFQHDFWVQREVARMRTTEPEFLLPKKLRQHYESWESRFPRGTVTDVKYSDIVQFARLDPEVKVLEVKRSPLAINDASDVYVLMRFRSLEESPLQSRGSIVPLESVVVRIKVTPRGQIAEIEHLKSEDVIRSEVPFRLITARIGLARFVEMKVIGGKGPFTASLTIDGEKPAQSSKSQRDGAYLSFHTMDNDIKPWIQASEKMKSGGTAIAAITIRDKSGNSDTVNFVLQGGTRNIDPIYVRSPWFDLWTPVTELAGWERTTWMRRMEDPDIFAATILWRKELRRPEEKREWDVVAPSIQKAADAGSPWALGMLGYMCCTGKGVPKDTAKGVKALREASRLGDSFGQAQLGAMLRDGTDVEKDPVAARILFRKSAGRGNVIAQRALGVMCDTGLGGEKDPAEAVKWLETAAKAGDEEAKSYLSKMVK